MTVYEQPIDALEIALAQVRDEEVWRVRGFSYTRGPLDSGPIGVVASLVTWLERQRGSSS